MFTTFHIYAVSNAWVIISTSHKWKNQREKNSWRTQPWLFFNFKSNKQSTSVRKENPLLRLNPSRLEFSVFSSFVRFFWGQFDRFKTVRRRSRRNSNALKVKDAIDKSSSHFTLQRFRRNKKKTEQLSPKNLRPKTEKKEKDEDFASRDRNIVDTSGWDHQICSWRNLSD